MFIIISSYYHRPTKERDWQRGPEVAQGSYRSRVSLATENGRGPTCVSECKRFLDVLDSLGSGVCCNSFSKRGKRQEEVDCFKRAILAGERQEQLQRFCNDLIQRINRCIAEPATSVDQQREKSYQMFYQAQTVELNKLWDDFHAILSLPRPDVIWTQTVNRLLFNQALVACIEQDAKQEQQPGPSVLNTSEELGADEDNIIRYMAGYIPFKLMKVYEKKDAQEDVNVLDCLSEMAVAGAGDDLYAYTQEWTRAINRGGLFEVKDSVYIFFRKLEIRMRGILPQHLLRGNVDKEAVHTHILQDKDLLSDWDDLSSQLSYKKASVLLKEIINLWMTIRGHAFAKQMLEQYKRDKGKVTKKSAPLRGQLK